MSIFESIKTIHFCILKIYITLFKQILGRILVITYCLNNTLNDHNNKL